MASWKNAMTTKSGLTPNMWGDTTLHPETSSPIQVMPMHGPVIL